MGHATAEAVVRGGLPFVPYSFTGSSEAVAVGNVGVSGIPVELVAPAERQSAMERLKAQFPGLIIIDFTLPSAVNGAPAKTMACTTGKGLQVRVVGLTMTTIMLRCPPNQT